VPVVLKDVRASRVEGRACQPFPNAFPGEALFKGVGTIFGLRIVENCFENAFGNVGSAFPNLRLGSIIIAMCHSNSHESHDRMPIHCRFFELTSHMMMIAR
jgi:hypothetical protein